eukprot:755020-Hanusia_phi.AAC.5
MKGNLGAFNSIFPPWAFAREALDLNKISGWEAVSRSSLPLESPSRAVFEAREVFKVPWAAMSRIREAPRHARAVWPNRRNLVLISTRRSQKCRAMDSEAFLSTVSERATDPTGGQQFHQQFKCTYRGNTNANVSSRFQERRTHFTERAVVSDLLGRNGGAICGAAFSIAKRQGAGSGQEALLAHRSPPHLTFKIPLLS